jgi:hypothetical protein
LRVLAHSLIKNEQRAVSSLIDRHDFEPECQSCNRRMATPVASSTPSSAETLGRTHPLIAILGRDGLAREPTIVQLRQVKDSEYRGGLEAHNLWGCAIASLIVLPIFGYLTLINGLGDCASDTNCHKGFWSNVGLPTVAVFIVVFLSVRWAAKALRSGD